MGAKRSDTWSPDSTWTSEQWKALVEGLVEDGLVTWKEVAAIALGELNPPHVGTSLASNAHVKAVYGKRTTWPFVREWFYSQSGRCVHCGTRLGLQADHITPVQQGGNWTLSNFQLLCRRCNVIKRPSHKKGGRTYLSAESALMWLLLVHRPRTYPEYKSLCRKYGLTMASIRFEEAWAMAEWLKREGKY